MHSKDGKLIGGDELFHEGRFIDHYNFMLAQYQPRSKRPIAFFMSCSKHKPFYKSPYRRVFNSMLTKKLKIREISQIYTVSEPAIIVPEEMDDTNISNYDFPPDRLQEEGREIFIERLLMILPKLLKAHKHSFYALPKHHRQIFEGALKRIAQSSAHLDFDRTILSSRLTYIPPVIYNLPKARAIIEFTLNQKKLV